MNFSPSLVLTLTNPALHFILELVDPSELDISERRYQFVHEILYHSSALWWRSMVWYKTVLFHLFLLRFIFLQFGGGKLCHSTINASNCLQALLVSIPSLEGWGGDLSASWNLSKFAPPQTSNSYLHHFLFQLGCGSLYIHHQVGPSDSFLRRVTEKRVDDAQ